MHFLATFLLYYILPPHSTSKTSLTITRYPFDSDEAQQLNKDIFETIYYAALKASCELAREQGVYESYEGCPVSKGVGFLCYLCVVKTWCIVLIHFVSFWNIFEYQQYYGLFRKGKLFMRIIFYKKLPTYIFFQLILSWVHIQHTNYFLKIQFFNFIS